MSLFDDYYCLLAPRTLYYILLSYMSVLEYKSTPDKQTNCCLETTCTYAFKVVTCKFKRIFLDTLTEKKKLAIHYTATSTISKVVPHFRRH